MRAIELDGAYNVRDLGGLPTVDGKRTRPGLLYRGDSLDALSARDQDLLFSALKIGAVIDLRTEPEVKAAPWRDVVNYYRFPLISEGKIGVEPLPVGAPAELGRMYLGNAEEGTAALGATFEALAAHLGVGTPCIVHCAAGRDRTGVTVAVLLSLLGVTQDAIAGDYAESNRHADDVARKLAENPLYANGQAHGPGVVMALPESIRVFLDLLSGEYGSAEAYATQAGVRAAVIHQLRAALVGDSTGEDLPDAALVS